jgi:hypothetical protein
MELKKNDDSVFIHTSTTSSKELNQQDIASHTPKFNYPDIIQNLNLNVFMFHKSKYRLTP